MRSPRVYVERAILGGFTLVRIFAGIAAILVVLAVAIPTYFGSRIATLEAAVTEQLHTIHRAQAQCRARSGQYCETLESLGAAGAQHGYVFTMTSTASTFTVTAEPQPYHGFSRRTIHVDQTGAVRYSWSTVQGEEAK